MTEPVKNEKTFLNHYSIGIALVLVCMAYLYRLVTSPANAADPIPLPELTGKKIHGLAIYTVYWITLVYAYAGRKIDVVKFAKDDIRSFINLLAAIIIGAALVLAK